MPATLWKRKIYDFFGKNEYLTVPHGRGKKPYSEKSVDVRSKERFMSNSLLNRKNMLKAVKENKVNDKESVKENKVNDKESVKVYTRPESEAAFSEQTIGSYEFHDWDDDARTLPNLKDKEHTGNHAFDAVDLYSPTKMAVTLWKRKIYDFFGKKDNLRVPFGRREKPDFEKSVDMRSKEIFLYRKNKLKEAKESKDKDKASVKVYTRWVGEEVFWDKKLEHIQT